MRPSVYLAPKGVRLGQKWLAIYTRKSTDEGLEQDFNSLDAQREACEQYIKSQAHLGWKLTDDRYDDGGFTGANIDRPAFARLLADIEAGKIDVVVVYKVDRLSRSLLDFAKVMDRFNQAGVAFVSVTQNFSTADAMGRLTLNMLMSLRRVRTRDDQRANPRQDRRLAPTRQVDRRRRAHRLRGAGQEAGHRRARGPRRPRHLRALPRPTIGARDRPAPQRDPSAHQAAHHEQGAHQAGARRGPRTPCCGS